jgi:hypothetical protein
MVAGNHEFASWALNDAFGLKLLFLPTSQPSSSFPPPRPPSYFGAKQLPDAPYYGKEKCKVVVVTIG